MIILGIDPGTAMTGYGLIECDKKNKKIKSIKHGSIKTSNIDNSATRLKLIHQEILTIIKDHQPKILAIESLFFNSNAKSASAVGQAIGVVKLAACLNKIEVFEYPPLKIKMKLVGKGRAEKKEVQSKVRQALRLKKIPRPTHAADALAVAICHWLENQ